MSERHQDLWRWMDAEDSAGDWDAADAAFAAVASAWLPMVEAPAGLTERIVAAAAATADTSWTRTFAALAASRWVRGTVGAAMLLLGVALTVIGFGQVATVGMLLAALSAAGRFVLDASSMTWGACAAAWPVIVSLGRAAADVAATRTAAIVIFANLGLAGAALAGLSHLHVFAEEES